jgi:hypothetical protein
MTPSTSIYVLAIGLWLSSKFRSEKIPRNRLVMVFRYSAEFRVYRKIQFRSSEPNGTKQNSAVIMKLYDTKQLTKVVIFRVFSAPKNGLQRIFKCFLFRKWFGIEFRVFFLPTMVRNGIPKFSFLKIVRKGIPRFYNLKMVRNGIPRFFLFQEMVRNGIPRFFSSAKQAEYRRNSRLFRLVSYSTEYFFCRKMTTLAGHGSLRPDECCR